jgi:hypothetical protein
MTSTPTYRLRLPASWQEAITKHAERSGMTASEFIRVSILLAMTRILETALL